MNPIAVVNGVKVFSTKEMKSIVGSRINFTDGSYCDVRSNEVVNIGTGSISLGSPSQGSVSAETKKVGPIFFAARELNVFGISANVHVSVGKSMSITIEGPGDEVDAIEPVLQGDVLVVKGPPAQSINIGGISIGSISASSIVVGSGNENVQISGGTSSTRVDITVPKGTKVSVNGADGNTTIGDTEGSVQASVRGAHDFSIGRVGDATLSVLGSGDIDVTNVTGVLIVSVQGSGNVNVQSGTVSALTASVMGSGDIDFLGRAEHATLSIMGDGEISVAHVTNRPVTQVHGSGDITVGNW